MPRHNRLNELLNLKRESTLSEFQTRFVFPFAVFVAATVILFSVFVIFRSQSLQKSSIEREQLTSTRIVAMGVERSLGGAVETLQSLAKSGRVRSGDPKEIASSILSDYVGNNAILSSMAILDTSGNTLAATSKNVSGATLQDDCFNRVAGGSAAQCFSDVKLDQDGNHVTIVFVPVEGDNDAPVRILAAAVSINADQIKTPVLGATPGTHGFAVLVDGSGNVVLNGDNNTRNAPVNLRASEPVRSALSGNKGTVVYKYGNKNMLATFSPIEGPGWAILLQRPTSEIGGIGGYLILSLIFLVFGTVGAVIVAVVQSQSVTRFLFQLTGRIDNIANRGLDTEIPVAAEPKKHFALEDDDDVPSAAEEIFGRAARASADEDNPLELSRLSSSFNTMLKSMRDERKRSESSFKEAVESAKFNQSVFDGIGDLLLVVGTNMNIQIANQAAAKFCSQELTSLPGRPLSALGPSWSQHEITDAVRRVIRENQAETLSDLSMSSGACGCTSIELRVFPLPGKAMDKPAGAIIYGRELGDIIALREKIKQTASSFSELISAANDPLLILDKDLRIEWASATASKLLRPDSSGIEEAADIRQWLSGASKTRIDQAAARALETGEMPNPFEIELDIKGGKTHVEVSLSRAVDRDGARKVILTVRRVPQIRKVERQALRDRETTENKIRFLTGAIDAIPTAIALTEASGRIIQVNKAFERLFAERRNVFMGKMLTAFHGGDSRFFDFNTLIHAGSAKLECYMKNAKGARFLADATAIVLKDGPNSTTGGPGALLCSFREIGGERASNERARREASDTAVVASTHEIADKLMTPLSGVINSLQALGGNIFSDKNRGMWNAAMRGCKAMNQSLNMMLLYSMDQPMKTGPCRMEEIIEEVVDTLDRHGMIPPGINIEREYAPDLPACESDAEQVKMVVWNLILNSVQAVEMRPNDAVVQINVYARNHKGAPMVVVDVLDSGPELDQTEMPLFFEPFYGNRPGGIGLGLTLSRRAVEKHGGRIGMERKDGYTRVSFAIPTRVDSKLLSNSSQKPHAASRNLN